jgi:NADH-quinone oxidoreductase subunit J
VSDTHSYLSPTGIEIAFVLIGLIVLGSAVLVVTVQNLVHAALWLVVCLGAIGAEYLLLGAELVAWVQILIYLGAVVVLLMFGLMLTKAPIGPTTELDVKHRLPAVLVGCAAAGVLVTVVCDAYRTAWFDPRAAVAQDAASAGGNSRAVGAALFRYWVLPFETLSVLLLAALVGAIVLSRRNSSATPDTDPAESATTTAVPGPGPGPGSGPGPAPVPSPSSAPPRTGVNV